MIRLCNIKNSTDLRYLTEFDRGGEISNCGITDKAIDPDSLDIYQRLPSHLMQSY